MGRGQMRNLETFGVGTGDINEFEYQKNQGELTEQLEHQGNRDAVPEPITPAERVKQIIADAHEKVEERKRKGLNRAAKKKAPAKKAGARKPAAKKSASKRSTAKSAKKSAKKSEARKSAKTSTKKSAAKKSTKKAAAKQSKARKR